MIQREYSFTADEYENIITLYNVKESIVYISDKYSSERTYITRI
jgi:hypothetical protein